MSQVLPPQKNIGFLDIIWHFKLRLAAYILVISFLTFIGLYLFGGVPEELRVLTTTEESPIEAVEEAPRQYVQLRNRPQFDDSVPLPKPTPVTPAKTTTTKPTAAKPVANTTVATPKGALPTYISISKIGVSTAVVNPTSTNNDVLNQNLLKGAVRYPGSGTLEQGNMFIMGHSSGLKVVNNKAYKAFNGLKNLSFGDSIVVTSGGKTAVYAVSSVSLVDSDEGFVNLKTNTHMLTLVTCNVFGEKEERFLVEATFVKFQ
ncbi:MAG: sortase [Patescibacteria group bacterium]